ncbi:hypothetical protein TSAR_010725 [Trichomalopsis sarcophagae]|uniref:Uncharacterized protein n=1 Tax=Trichomalopsis sarcophagae TaxID=543379 RepID=A0A232ENK6_9HYME|nr:hypothetical protein TSAR_010725 [Trichomalopsis sarcophagae]
MSTIERSLEPLDEIPRPMNRVTVVEADVAVLRAESTSKESLSSYLRKELVPLRILLRPRHLTLRPFGNSVTLMLGFKLNWIELHRPRLNSLQSLSLQGLLLLRLRLLDFRLMQPLSHSRSADIERYITSARPLIQRRAVREDDANSAITSVAVTEMRLTPIAVTVSRTLMRSLISAKIKIRKLHTKQRSADLLRDARVTLPLPDSFININEYMPLDVHRLSVATRAAARGIGCSTFVRDGQIYIRAKNEARAVMIRSEEDFKNLRSTLILEDRHSFYKRTWPYHGHSPRMDSTPRT